MDTNEGNKGKKDIIEGQSPIQSIVSANTTLIDKGKSNPHHHSISTTDPFHTIIKNIRSNAETTDLNTKLSDKVVNVIDVSIMSC